MRADSLANAPHYLERKARMLHKVLPPPRSPVTFRALPLSGLSGEALVSFFMHDTLA